MKNGTSIPKLTLVGAGPGDEDLITVKGIKALAEADVILYDALVNESLLGYAPVKTKKIFVGKKAQSSIKANSNSIDMFVISP